MDTARAYVDFVQHRYEVSQGSLRQATQLEAEAIQERDRFRDQVRDFGALQMRYTGAERLTTKRRR
ncbi:hypothetical protein V7S43_013687 [Phytophthora oleae]|uniref:Uncharacterized protein n=1 Tax=Phytophthora oleae TaxID=2107226 RepID=A0ABD3F8W3_9STRA